MDKSIIVCPFCKCEENWYIHTNGDEKVYQCIECIRYFRIKDPHKINADKLNETKLQESRAQIL